MKSELLIVDGRHLLWRAASAFEQLSCKINGEVLGTGAIYGFVCAMLRIHNRYGGVVCVAWEGDKFNFRKDLYPKYKQREEPTEEKQELIDDMAMQERRLWALLRSIGVRQYMGLGCEADDVIGRLALSRMAKLGHTVIYSGDSDLRQLVTNDVSVAAPGFRGKPDAVYDAERVEEKHGVTPEQIPDLKALSGDSSDNIPGIRGIGPKTASTAIKALGSAEGVIEAAESDSPMPIAERHRQTIRDGADNIRLFKELTTIKIDCRMDEIKPDRDKKRMLDYFRMYRFASMMQPVELRGFAKMGEVVD